MYIVEFIENIKNICNLNISTDILYEKIKTIFKEIDNKLFLNDFKNYNCNINILIKNNISNNTYIKHILFSSSDFDVILIEWEKFAETHIHDHPDKGCIVKILCGELEEDCYDNRLNFINKNILLENNIGYKISNKILHKIFCKEDTFSLHVYVPGKFNCNIYKQNF
jgi:hypothetical protein